MNALVIIKKAKLFTGEIRVYCNIYKQLYDSTYESIIFSISNVLILILNRRKNNILDIKLDFIETIDTIQFVLQPDNPKIIYNLYGVITHIKQSDPNAKFVASCKNSINNKWYRFNDEFVRPITDFKRYYFIKNVKYMLMLIQS